MKVKGTVREIKERLSTGTEVSDTWIQELLQDSRAGVQKLARSYLRKKDRLEKEAQRISKMWKFEHSFRKQGYHIIAGVDEAGRGPLAGPVVAAAVVLPASFDAKGLNDSKKLSVEERASLRVRIEKEAVAIGVSVVDNTYIEKYNILQATYEAMRRSILQLKPIPEMILLDAVKLPGMELPQHSIVKGDALSHSIAAASVIAKTVRDEWMIQAASRYPEYGFEHHMGYGTPEHLKALERFGPCSIHRRTFAPVNQYVSVSS